jgi:hypothetical protein
VGRVEQQVGDQGAQNHRSVVMFTSRLPMHVDADDGAVVAIVVVVVEDDDYSLLLQLV